VTGCGAPAHRGAVVNVAEIAEVRVTSHGDGRVHLRNGMVLRLSRRYRRGLQP
jgi:DNA-binding LytR/AlgR family response regulator